MAKLNVQEGQNWKLLVNQAGTATLATANTFMDRDLEIQVPQGQISVAAQGTESTEAPAVSSYISNEVENSITGAAGITQSKEAGKKYLSIVPGTTEVTPASASVSFSGQVSVSTPGYIDSDGEKPVSADDVEFVSHIENTGDDESNAFYLEVKELDEGILSGTAEHVHAENGKGDNFKVKVVVPAGYYDEEQVVEKTFADVLPAIDDDAADNQILYGHKAYDEDGNILTGTMSNYSGTAPTLTQVEDLDTHEKGVTTITQGEGLVLSEDNASGIAVSAKGLVNVYASIENDGYYTAINSDSKSFQSDEATKYIEEITVASGKTLKAVSNMGTITSVSNTGTIGTLSGVGAINEISGSQTINSLTGTINVVASSDADINTADSAGKIKFGEKTLVTDGKLIKAQSSVNGNTVSLTEGWFDGGEVDSVATGEYDVEGSGKDAAVTIVPDTAGVATTTTSPYAISISGNVTKGSYKAVSKVTTTGYIEAGSKETAGDIDVNVTGATVYLREATFSKALSAELNEGTSVPKTYDVNSVEGYIGSETVASIPVFNGEFAWS